MRNVDFSPLYRNAIGFDRLLNLMETNNAKNTSGGYPPYNIEKKDDNHQKSDISGKTTWMKNSLDGS